jgi:DNA repair protein RadC
MRSPSPKQNQGHRQRLRERFLTAGLDGFHDYEVIELLLTLGTPRKDCKGPAKQALKRFKTLPGVLEASLKDLCEVDGIGPKNAIGIRLIKATTERYLKQRLIPKSAVHNSQELFDYLCASLRDKSTERFKVLFLDTRNCIIAVETLFFGSVAASAVYPREVLQAALKHNATALIFAHNHPSGDPAPSEEDIAITKRLIHACNAVGITVHEHLVVGANRYFSFADHGLIQQLQPVSNANL